MPEGVSIELHGQKGERFLEIKRAVAEHLGYEPSNAEVAGILMARVERRESNDRKALT